MPRIPVIQHQNMAPGPPRAMAVETPTIFPVPRVAARVADRVAKADRFCCLPFPEGRRESLMAFQIFFCGKCSFMVK
ncbi:unknown [Firmicutes bacterium CAG:534]|nr:unknown [Firmicutes bacterium CAG:534]